jgi:predicted nucleic acid-binding protein
VKLRDRSDIEILGSALACGAELFVTGDKELQALRCVEGLAILSPRAFWQRLKDGQEGESNLP